MEGDGCTVLHSIVIFVVMSLIKFQLNVAFEEGILGGSSYSRSQHSSIRCKVQLAYFKSIVHQPRLSERQLLVRDKIDAGLIYLPCTNIVLDSMLIH